MLINDFFVKDLHGLHDEADVSLLMLSFRGALWQGGKVTDSCIPLSHCIALLIQSRVVKLQKQDVKLCELWDRLLIQHFVPFRAKQVEHDLPSVRQGHRTIVIIKLALQAGLKYLVNGTKCPKLVLLLLLTKFEERQKEHVQLWRIQSQKLVAVILSLFDLLPRIVHGHCKHIDRFCQFRHVYPFVSCCHESFAFKNLSIV